LSLLILSRGRKTYYIIKTIHDTVKRQNKCTRRDEQTGNDARMTAAKNEMERLIIIIIIIIIKRNNKIILQRSGSESDGG